VVSATADPSGRPSIREAIEPLDGELVHLRPATPADTKLLASIIVEPSVDAWWQAPDPARDVAELLADDELAIWIIEADATPIGLVMASEEVDPQYRHASIDIAIVAAGQGRGRGRDTVRTVARWLIERRGHHRLTIDPSAANERAIRAYAAVGFRPVGAMRQYERRRDGSWHDGLLMDLLADELV
jgi:aminoglycoside 6'-N-acetyltransferase